MRLDQKERFAISVEQAQEVALRLEGRGGRALMQDRLMVRTLFSRLPATGGRARRSRARPPGAKVQRESRWIRVRQGDVDVDGESRVRVTYKVVDRVADEEVERAVDLVVANYDECVALLVLIGLRSESIQETYRTKYVAEFQDRSYVVSIDQWPWLEAVRFVGVQPVEGYSADVDLTREFCESLGLGAGEEYTGGVDKIYRERLGFAVSEVEDVRFGIPLPKVAARRE